MRQELLAEDVRGTAPSRFLGYLHSARASLKSSLHAVHSVYLDLRSLQVHLHDVFTSHIFKISCEINFKIQKVIPLGMEEFILLAENMKPFMKTP